MHRIPIPTKDGEFTAWFSERGLARLEFPGNRPNRLSTPQAGKPALRSSVSLRRWQQQTANALRQALAGETPKSLPPLDLSAGTAFQQAVWKALVRIPQGQTRSYAQLAASVGKPLAVRAAGGACGANPIPVLVPCHRVVPKGGGLGGFSAGLEWKRRLIARENITLQ